MYYLSEDNIKLAALRFLKSYYKFRPRSSETEAQLDMRTEGGIIADGHLMFKTDTGEAFLATLEATSRESINEVKYNTQNTVLNWDCLAIGSLIAAFIASYGYLYDHFTVKELGMAGFGALFLGILFFCFMICRFFLANYSRYRYIYAVEQFKNYFANEQWCAIGEDVFGDPENKYLKELKNQCVLNGFGLLQVDKDMDAHLIITPSREVVRRKRKQRLFSASKYTSKVTENARVKKVWERAKGMMPKWKLKSPVNLRSLNRYQKTYSGQVFIFCLSLGIISAIFFKEIQNPDIVYVDEHKYAEKLSKLTTNKEAKGYKLDSVFVEPYEEEHASYLNLDGLDDGSHSHHNHTNYKLENDSRGMLELEADPDGITPKIKLNNDEPSKNKKEIITSTKKDGVMEYDCARFYNLKGTFFLVEDRVFKDLVNAQERLDYLKSKNIEASILWLGCFGESEVYSVYIDLIYEKRQEANQAMRVYKQFMTTNKHKLGKLKIRPITR